MFENNYMSNAVDETKEPPETHQVAEMVVCLRLGPSEYIYGSETTRKSFDDDGQ